MIINYLTYPDPSKYGGIINKLNGTVRAINSNGHESRLISGGPSFKGFFSCCSQLAFSNHDIIIMRNTFLMPLFIPMLLILKIKGVKIILDLPTPLCAAVKEFDTRRNSSFMGKKLKKLMLHVTYPMVFVFFNRVVQYAPDNKYFSFGIKYKVKKIGNGIDVSSVNQVKVPLFKSRLTLIGVGGLADWHGFDRVINSLVEYQDEFHFIIVGDGGERGNLEKLTNDLNLNQCVTFTGILRNDDLEEVFNVAHVAVSSLGLHRLGLEEASVLKAREYCARGLPFISATKDVDFIPNPGFVFQIDDNDSNINMQAVFEWYENLTYGEPYNKKIRDYAFDKLDFKKKTLEILS